MCFYKDDVEDFFLWNILSDVYIFKRERRKWSQYVIKISVKITLYKKELHIILKEHIEGGILFPQHKKKDVFIKGLMLEFHP